MMNTLRRFHLLPSRPQSPTPAQLRAPAVADPKTSRPASVVIALFIAMLVVSGIFVIVLRAITAGWDPLK